MTPEQLAKDAEEAIADGTNVVLTRKRGAKLPHGFPRGTLLSEEHDGRLVYAYDPRRVIEWLRDNGLLGYAQP